MAQMEMVHPTCVADAAAALAKRGAVALAGATDLIPSIRKREIAPRLLVNLKSITGLSGIKRVRGGVRIGALTTVAELLRSEIIAAELPLLREVAYGFASVQIRNLATVGGNLCTASPSADLALPLLVLDAVLEAHGPRGAKDIDVADFFLGAGASPPQPSGVTVARGGSSASAANRTALRRGEILTAITIPKLRAHTGAAHAKLGIRQAMDLAFVGVAAAVQLAPDGRKCRTARIALGSVAPIPMRARKAEALLEGQPLTDELIAEAAAAAAAESRPISDLRASKEYRRQMVEVLTRRALHEALRRAAVAQIPRPAAAKEDR